MAKDLQKHLTFAVKDFNDAVAVKAFARFAKDELAEMIRTGEGSPSYDRYVNGKLDVVEEDVVPPGPIAYYFNWLDSAAQFALSFLRARWNVRGPGKGGHYVDSFFVLADGKEIPAQDASKHTEIIITNDQPYSRKAHLGTKGFLLPKGLFEDCRQAMLKYFGRGLLDIDLRFIELNNGYMLRRTRKMSAATGRNVGTPMRYPALEVRARHD